VLIIYSVYACTVKETKTKRNPTCGSAGRSDTGGVIAKIITQYLGLDSILDKSFDLMPQLKLGNIRVIFPNFQNCACCEKYLRDNKHSVHLARKYAQIFVRGHYLFLEGNSFPRA